VGDVEDLEIGEVNGAERGEIGRVMPFGSRVSLTA